MSVPPTPTPPPPRPAYPGEHGPCVFGPKVSVAFIVVHEIHLLNKRMNK